MWGTGVLPLLSMSIKDHLNDSVISKVSDNLKEQGQENM